MGSRLHGNDGRRRAHPQSSARIHAPTIVIPAKAGIHGDSMGSRLHGNDGRRRAHPQSSARIHGRAHNRHSRDGGNPRGGPAMGSRLHGNDGRRRPTPQSSFPQQRESTAATIVIPATAGIHGGGPAMGSRLHGNDGRRRAHPQSSARIHGPTIVIPATAGIHGGAGDGFPSARERRAAAGAPTIVGENPRPHNRHSPRRRESTGGGRRWVPVCTGTTGGGGRTHNRHSRDGGNPRVGAVTHGKTGGGGRTHNLGISG